MYGGLDTFDIDEEIYILDFIAKKNIILKHEKG